MPTGTLLDRKEDTSVESTLRFSSGEKLAGDPAGGVNAVFSPTDWKIRPMQSELSQDDVSSSLEQISQASLKAAKFERVVRLSAEELDDRRFEVLTQWEGVVTKVFDTTFSADIVTKSRGDTRREFVDLPIEELFGYDLDLLEVGSSFYWTLGHLIEPGGQVSRCSRIRFKRIPLWKDAQIERVKAEADRLFTSLFEGENEDRSSE